MVVWPGISPPALRNSAGLLHSAHIGYPCRPRSGAPEASAAMDPLAAGALISEARGGPSENRSIFGTLLTQQNEARRTEALYLCFLAWRGGPSQESWQTGELLRTRSRRPLHLLQGRTCRTALCGQWDCVANHVVLHLFRMNRMADQHIRANEAQGTRTARRQQRRGAAVQVRPDLGGGGTAVDASQWPVGDRQATFLPQASTAKF